MIKKSWIFVLTISLWLAGASWANAVPKRPMETLRGPIDRIIEVLNDPAFHNADKKTLQRDKIWQIARPIFDFDEISRRVIGRKSWNSFSADEKKRFTTFFSEYLGNVFIDKLQGEYHDEKIDYKKELVKGTKALVRTRLRRESAEIPFTFLMLQVDGAWKIFDLLMENDVSILAIYKAEFYDILRENTPAQLIDHLEKKLDNHN
jgi:phospholipid transport system substrate-binding protein